MAKKIASPKAVRPACKPIVDYPREGEIVRPGHYSIRLTAAGAGQVQARLNAGEWSDCREAVGHHWFDWTPVVGPVLIEARARIGKGRWTAAPARACVVSA
ncbi:MAG: hypothetical protein KGJ84_11850 [Elusimicrobia bacterium]|nr:hypothetical protein [Elusimicrobiota bacterium]